MDEQIQSKLKQYWPEIELRDIQYKIIQSVLCGRDTLALLPTGGGKSLCYQLPAVCGEGICIVVSPLIALMEDQVSSLRQRNIEADYIHSGMHWKEIERIFSNAAFGKTKLLYISPERIESERAKQFIEQMNVSFVAIDEAHCISQWGHDFRPAYVKIKELRNWIKPVPFLALTATATQLVKQEIIDILELKEPNSFSVSFARNNISILIRKEENKFDACLHVLKKMNEPAIVYVRSRLKTQELARYLNENSISADYYHAGLEYETRIEKQKNWQDDKSRVMVSTNAFGMGINKANVRVVIHMEPPPTLEEYYQEMGRAGRDGKPSFAIMFYHSTDIDYLFQSAEQQFPEIKFIQHVYRDLALYADLGLGYRLENSVDFDLQVFCNTFKHHAKTTSYAIHILEQSGWITVSPSIHLPSKIHITGSTEELQLIKDSDEKHAKILETILRSLEGVFAQPTIIHEAKIAEQLRLDVADVISILKKWEAEGILDYFAAKEKPQLFFSTLRQKSEHVFIDKNWYASRKNQYESRIQAVAKFILDAHCRQSFILAYFNEKPVGACGICDYCRERELPIPTEGDILQMKSKIKSLIGHKEWINIRSVYQSFPMDKKRWVDIVLQDLIGNQELERKFNQLRIPEL